MLIKSVLYGAYKIKVTLQRSRLLYFKKLLHFSFAFLSYLFASPSSTVAVSDCRVNRRRFVPPAFSNTRPQAQQLSLRASLQLAQELVEAYRLNQDQAAALTQIARMIAAHPSVEGTVPEEPVHPITIIHGKKRARKHEASGCRDS